MPNSSYYWNTNYQGWAFNDALLADLRPGWTGQQWDAAFPSPDDRYAALLHSISEVSNNVLAARFLLAENRDAPRILLPNLPNLLGCRFNAPEPWLSTTICLARVWARHYQTRGRDFAFALFDLPALQFTILGPPSDRHGRLTLEGDRLRFSQARPDPAGQVSAPVDQSLGALTWYPFEDLGSRHGLDPYYEHWCRQVDRNPAGQRPG